MVSFGKLQESHPLSPVQAGMLMHSLQEKDSGTYFQQLIITCFRPVNFKHWHRAWEQLVERHDMLRVRFDIENQARPLQHVYARASGSFREHDWTIFPEEEQEKRFEAFLQFDRRQGFDFSKSLPWHWNLFRLSDSCSRLVWSSHHALFDGRSRLLLLEELFSLYDSLEDGTTPNLPQPCPVDDYLRWACSMDEESARNYWDEYLRGFSKPSLIPDFAASASDRIKAKGHITLADHIPESLTTSLHQLAKENRISMNTLLQGAWALLLSFYSGKEDVVFGATRACRHVPVEGAESLVGLMINTLPVRVAVDAEANLLEWLIQLRKQWIELRDYENTSLVKIRQWSEIPQGEPLFESIVVFENYRLESALRERNDRWRSIRIRLSESPHYPLVLAGYLDSELSIQITYDRERFRESTITHIRNHLRSVLQSIACRPRQQVGEVEILTPREREMVLNEWNRTSVDFPHASIPQLFEQQVQERPQAVALVLGDHQWTYEVLNQHSNGLAHRLKAAGVAPGTAVGICADRSLEWVSGLLAILKAGGIYVPLDPSNPSERMNLILKETSAPVVLCQSGMVTTFVKLDMPYLVLDPDTGFDEAASPGCSIKPESLAYIMYTSGSTGRPKGVMVSHKAVAGLVFDASYVQLEVGQRIACAASVAFDAATFEIWGALLRGGTCVLVPGAIPSFATLKETLARHQVDTLFLTTAWFNAVMDEDPGVLSGVRQLLFGGEAHSPFHVGKACQALPDTSIIHVYGPTEATTFSTFYPIPQGGLGSQEAIPIGRPTANTTIYIADGFGRLVPPGISGEILIGGAGIAEGYLNQSELTEERFILDPYHPEAGNRLFKSGDLARYLPDGDIEFLGRLDDQLKIRGYRIEPSEIESVLMSHPQIRQSAVLARKRQNGTDLKLCAYVVSSLPATSAAEHELRRFAEQRLPVQMVPADYVFLDQLPLTSNGKLDRQRLPHPVDVRRPEKHPSSRSPATKTEQQLLLIFSELLNRGDVELEDDLFDLGLDSILAMRAMSRVNEAFGYVVTISDFIRLRTIAALANKLSS